MALLLETKASESGSVVQYLTFRLGGENYGVPIERVREILEFSEPTVIPMMPAFLRGVINLRGAVVPVIDLQSRFGRDKTVAAPRSCIVIVEIEHDEQSQSLGILVDAVDEVIAVERSRIEPKPSFGTKIRSDFVDGLLNLERHFVVTLDIQQVLSIEELATLAGSVADRN